VDFILVSAISEELYFLQAQLNLFSQLAYGAAGYEVLAARPLFCSGEGRDRISSSHFTLHNSTPGKGVLKSVN
jgi:hypothetical protein